ncbi:MAG: hypothetical protein DRO88_10360 [Promethearchaeia archaeon]|nr:MAG: hypothetical protein DRO88_10360 [Candidatus Lokiarchaeia archaeon]
MKEMKLVRNEYFHSPIWKEQAQMDLPFLPTPEDTIKAIFETLNLRSPLYGKKLVDLGAGDGRVVFFAASFYEMYATAVEINEEMLQTMQISRDNLDNHHNFDNRHNNGEEVPSDLKERIEIIEADLFSFDVSKYDVVYAYPFPKCMKAFRHIWEQIKPGGCLVSIRWQIDFLNEVIPDNNMIKIEENLPSWIYFKE